jgi:hypothetical protein
VIDTSRFVLGNPRHILGGFLIVAMSVVHPLVADVIPSPKGERDGMVEFENVPVLKVEAASWALPFLDGQQFCSLVPHEGVLSESLGPVDQVSIVRTGMASDFDMVLTVRVCVVPHIQRFGLSLFVLDVRAKSAPSIQFDGVLVPGPPFAFLLIVSRLSPSCELSVGCAVTDAKGLRTDHPFVIVHPSPNDGVKATDDGFLWGCPPFPQEGFDFMRVALDGRFTGRDVCFEPKGLPIRSFPRVCFAHVELPYREA